MDNIEKLPADTRQAAEDMEHVGLGGITRSHMNARLHGIADRLEAMTREPVAWAIRSGDGKLWGANVDKRRPEQVATTLGQTLVDLFLAPPSPSVSEPEYGCHCDIENTVSGKPDGCVIDSHDYEDCIYAKQGMRKEDCKYWRPIALVAVAPKGANND